MNDLLLDILAGIAGAFVGAAIMLALMRGGK
jgi:uncharacterized membrane protein YeaQ/YmgE (transglycosylase-associated protein family)